MAAIRKRLFITAGITLAAMVAFMAVLPYDGRVGPGVLAGLFGRFLLLSYLGWVLAVGLHVIKLRNAHSIEHHVTQASGSVSAAQAV